MTFSLEQLASQYTASIDGLEQSAIERINRLIEGNFRALARELREAYREIAPNQSLLPRERQTLILERLQGLLTVIDPERREEFEEILREVLAASAELGVEAFEGFVRERNPDFDIEDTVGINTDAIAAIATESYQRLIKHGQEFADSISGILTAGLSQGMGVRRVSSIVRQRYGRLRGSVERLVRTETQSALNRAAERNYQRNDIDRVQLLVTADDRLCPYCAARNGYVYRLGEISVPLHPFCRCYLLPWREDWQERGRTQDEEIRDFRQESLQELEQTGREPNFGVAPFERAGGLESPPEPVWRP